MKKKTAVLIRRTPFNTIRNIEGLRMSVGATLVDDEVTVIFIDEGVRHAGKLFPEMVGAKDITKELEMLKTLKCRLIAESEAAISRDIELLEDVELLSSEEIAEMIAEFDVVIPW